MKRNNWMASPTVTIFVCTFLFGLAAHAYRYFNLLYSHDSLMIYQYEAGWQLSLGRFLQPVYVQLRGYLCAPFLLGMFSLLWLSFAIYFITKILGFQSKILIIPLCGILSTNATMTFTNATFLPWTDIFMLSLLFSVLAIYVYAKFQLGYLFGAFFMCVSLSLYQSYFQTAVILFLILMIKYIFDGHTFKFVLNKGLKALCTLVLGLILYYITLKVVLLVTSIEASTSYNGIASVGNYEGISLLQLLYDTYVYPINYFLHPETYNSRISAGLTFLLAALSGIGIVKIVYTKKISELNVLLLIILLLLMPFGMNVVFFISKGMEHSLMIFSFFFAYVFALLVLKYCCQKRDGNRRLRINEIRLLLAFKTVFSASMAFIILNNIVFANQVYLRKDLEYQATSAAMTRILDRIEQTEGYVMNETPVVLVGNLSSSKLMTNRPGFQEVTGVGMSNRSSVTYHLTYIRYFEQQLGYPINLASETERDEFAQKEEVKKMPVFPDKDSCKIVDGRMVVKLS